MTRQLAGGKRQVRSGSPLRRGVSMLVVAIGFGVGLSTIGLAQETAPKKDDGIDSLLEKLADPSNRTDKSDDKATKKEGQDGKKKESGDKATPGDRPGNADSKGDKARPKSTDGSSPLSGKDQEVDELLQKLGETTERPSPDDRRGGGGGGEKSDARGPSQKPEPNDRNKLSGKDKETDEHLEELTGRKRRKKADEEERTGPAGQIIKEMRDIEQKLAKPDTGDTTREEQKKVVKEIEKLIEEARQSGQSSMRRMMVRRVRQAGQQRGQQQGQEGAMAGGVGPSKPLKPPSKHSNASGKDIWGHLPPEMRALIENMIDELPLDSKAELIERYYTAVNKKKLVREETP
jgi:hypothetical protein